MPWWNFYYIHKKYIEKHKNKNPNLFFLTLASLTDLQNPNFPCPKSHFRFVLQDRQNKQIPLCC